MHNGYANRHFLTPKPAPKPIEPLHVVSNGRRISIYFMNDSHGEFLWIFNHYAPGGKQTIITEQRVCEFLGITKRTAKAWRMNEKKPDYNAIQLLYIVHTGQVIPSDWMKKGFSFTNDNYLQRGDAIFTPHDLAEVNQLKWILKMMQESALRLIPEPRLNDNGNISDHG